MNIKNAGEMISSTLDEHNTLLNKVDEDISKNQFKINKINSRIENVL